MKEPKIEDFTIVDKLTGTEFVNETEYEDAMKKFLIDKDVILHLCADIGSDSIFYQNDPTYHVIKIGIDIGVQNYNIPEWMIVKGIIANPVCKDLSTAPGFHKENDIDEGMFLVNHCFRIIDIAYKKHNLKWHCLENPSKGRLKEIIGQPNYIYQPWQYGSPWTKGTALWTGGIFEIPKPIYKKWDDVPKIPELYTRPGRPKPGLAFFHKSAVNLIPEMQWASEYIKTDADIRSMCSQGFAEAFYKCNP